MKHRAAFVIAVLLGAWLAAAYAQTPSTKTSLYGQIAGCFPDNTSGLITPAVTRQCFDNVVASFQQYAGVNAQVGTSYTIQSADYGQLLTFTNSSNVAVTVSSGASLYPFSFYVQNIGTGSVVLTPAAGTIAGQPSYALATQTGAFFISDNANWQVFTGQQTRSPITVSTTFYVNGSATSAPCGTFTCAPGSDANSGLDPTVPFQTIQHADDVLSYFYDIKGVPVTVQIADGIYQSSTAPVLLVRSAYLAAPPDTTGALAECPVTFQGNATTINNVIISSGYGGSAITAVAQTFACFKNLTVRISAGNGIQGASSTLLRLGKMAFTADAGHAFIWSVHSSTVELDDVVTIAGTVSSVLEANFNASIYVASTISAVGNITDTQFALSNAGSEISMGNQSILVGPWSVTGSRFTVQNSGAIWGTNQNLTYFPGSTNGTVEYGASYDSLNFSTQPAKIVSGANFGPTPPSVISGAFVPFRVRNSDGANSSITLESSGAPGGSFFAGLNSGGTAAAPSTTQSGQILALLGGYGYGVTGYAPVLNGGFVIKACQLFNDSTQCTQIDVYTTPNNASTSVRQWTFGDDGTLRADSLNNQGAGSLNIKGPLYINNAQTVSSPGQIVGTSTNDNAVAGNIGEYITSSIKSPGVSITTAVVASATYVLLTPGDWSCSGNVIGMVSNTTATTLFGGWISTGLGIPGAPEGGYNQWVGIVTNQNASVAVPPVRISTATTISAYLGADVTFTAGAQAIYGKMNCWRMR